MGNPRVFFQDFLFEGMPVNEQDYPDIKIHRLPEETDISAYKTISFDAMLRMNKLSEWESLFAEIDNRDVCIKDDVLMDNPEMEPYKRFYLGTYYYNISKHSRACLCHVILFCTTAFCGERAELISSAV